MDGLDLFTIDEVDQDVFNGSPTESDDEEAELPVPDCIGLDSAVQDEEQARLEQLKSVNNKAKTRSEVERELELKALKPGSLRRQILEQSLRDGSNNAESDSTDQTDLSKEGRAHVMNIVEKAGMRGIDKEKINEIIHEASKGSLFYKKQAQRQEEIHKSIEKMLTKVKMATPTQVANAKITCDKLIEDLEKHRVFNRIIVHFDLDMFFAAVEIRDNPELADKPIAVGGDSMVSTSNYIARRYGVRAAMPGFIARKLCPELKLIKPNGVKYRQASAEVFDILERYDPELTSMSLDEAYLDLTEYVKSTIDRDGIDAEEYYDGTLPKIWWTRASEIVEEIRQAIYDKTKLTCSAGVSCNTLLAKISTDINKPNGQFMVEGYARNVKDFISNTPVGKVSGIGKVSGQFLNALEIQTCGDLFEKRHFLPLVFYEINVKFYLRVALGDGSTCIKSDEQRKSKSVERTFQPVKDTLMLLDKLDSICEELCSKYLKPYRIRGRTITVKLKRNTFNTTTKSYSVLVPTNDKQVIYSAAKNLLLAEVANEPPEISYRLLGVRLSNLADEGVTANQMTIDAMLRNQELSRSTKSSESVHRVEEPQSEQLEPTEKQSPPLELVTQEEVADSNPESLKRKAECIDVGDVDDDKLNTTQEQTAPMTKKRIEDFFSATGQEQSKTQCVDHANTDGNGASKFLSQLDDEDFVGDGTEPNAISQTELKQNEPNDEDFRCPYCFKPFSDFNILEEHVERCYLKSNFDIYSQFVSQKTIKDNNSSDKLASTSTAKKSGRTPSAGGSTKRNSTKRQSKLNFSSSSQSTPSRPPSSDLSSTQISPKISYYQRFMESNSQILSQSPKVDPFQCPFCRHGFLNFGSLEAHVMVCTKNKTK